MKQYKPYPKYKPSGIEWLGDVPEHWEVSAFKRLATIKNGAEFKHIDDENGPYPVFGSGGVFSRARKYIYNGESVLLGRKGTIDKPIYFNGPFWVVDTMFYTEVHGGVSGRFLYYISTSIPFDFYSTNTALPSMTQDDLGNHIIAFPNYSEQSAIAAYLDHQTTQIDRLIEKKEQFIKLLQEKRQALITAAVTGKFDVRTGKPYPKYKPSGIEWLGEVPEHWEVRRLKDVGVLVAGSGFPHEYQNVQGEELYFYKVSDLSLSVDGKYLGKTKHTISRKVACRLGAKIIPGGAIVYAKIGAALLLNRRRITSSSCCIDNNMSAYIPNKVYISSEWAFRWLCIIDFNEHVNPGAVPSFGESYQAVLPIYVPPKDEQVLIESFLNHQTTQIDSLIEKTRQSIDLLKEKRTALITAAVTGKIDVRDWKPEAA